MVRKIEEIYKQYKKQIDTICLRTGRNLKKTAEIVSWFYGGSWESWRKFLAKISVKPPETGIVTEFLETLTKKSGKK